MTKAQLIEQMAKDAGISKTEAGKAFNSLIDGIGEAIKEENGRISLPGFGTFSKVYRKERQGVNPATGEKITIKARHAIKFRPGKALKDAIS
ncbi:MAG: HU family DNA-binding protein [Desulfobacteraceae bacterium]|nr:HU family DNA-binding protein [Pseudomonadota bacterium]MBU4463970.1 HU family DNA-binding protein [Pseudomonadota bacterium]MCG2755559.1 HU family DNA-binding protein [Desulfobacteraceae bacterium]